MTNSIFRSRRSTDEPKAKTRRVPVWAWLLIAVAALVALFTLPALVVVAALVVLVTAIVALSKGTPTFLRLKSRNVAIGATAASAAVLLIGASVSAAVLPRVSDPAPLAETVAASTPTPTPEETTATPAPTPTPVVSTREEVVVEAVAFEKSQADDPGMPRGQTALRTAGTNGERTLTYIVTLTHGVETARALSSDVVTRNPVTEVTAVGTYDAPPPPAPEPEQQQPAQGGGCDTNYSGACVPVDSDVDCAGGSGNGPSYVQGPVRVVGTDVYGLDSDSDGEGCES